MLIYRHRNILAPIALAALLAFALIGSCAWDTEDDPKLGGLSNTEDLGLYCYFDCDDVWCFMDNNPDCAALMCVGRPDNQYCTTYCLNDDDCPEGFTCTDNCNLGYDEPYCILDDHYETLVELTLCYE